MGCAIILSCSKFLWNAKALKRLKTPRKALQIMPAATHLFEDPGVLERVSQLAVAWFKEHLTDQMSPVYVSRQQ